MFRKINSIKNLGTFTDFSWQNDCEPFKRYNFIYGWNYSGKTTLSRLFRCLELKKLHQDYPNLQFNIQTDNGDITQKDIVNNNLLIRVFNEEFIEENFKWNDENHKINPVLILGKESIELNQKLIENENARKLKEEEKEKIKQELNTLNKQLVQSLTDKASEIRKLLNITNQREFDKSRLEAEINKIKDKYQSSILSDDEVQKKLVIYRNQRTYETISEISFDLKLNDLRNQVNQILGKKITAQQIIQKLKDNPALNKWVREGIDLHKNETKCQFCGNDLPPDLFERLNKHFSKEFDQLMQEIDTLEQEIKKNKNIIEKIQLPDKARLYEEIQDEYENARKDLQSKIKEILSQYDLFLNKLENKKQKPFDSLESSQNDNLKNEFINNLNKINNIIKKNNEKIQGLEEEKRNIKEELLNHYSASAIDKLYYFNKKREIETKDEEFKGIENEIQIIEQDIYKIKAQIEKSNIGAEKINKYLKDFFSDDHLKLNPLDDGNYQIYRNDTIAKNLSTGEKNIISLIYFITKLEENDFKIDDSIIFIDDPVSSLDSNHTFKVYGFLSEKILNCKQLFITTHNFEFLNLLKDIVKSDPEGTTHRQTKNDKENYYLIKRVLSNNGKVTIIENLPNVLRKFKSEYNYLFSILKQFNESQDKANFELLYILPNIVRRFLEAYLFQKYPDGKKFKDKCKKFFNDTPLNEKITLLKLIDEYSHEENPEHALKFPDINEVETCVKFILETLKNKDKEHYDSLCESFNKK